MVFGSSRALSIGRSCRVSGTTRTGPLENTTATPVMGAITAGHAAAPARCLRAGKDLALATTSAAVATLLQALL